MSVPRATREAHQAYAVTDLQLRRLARGQTESRPEDYKTIKDPQAIRERDARRRLEDLAMARESDYGWEDV
jgi:hypothetical protein